MSRRWRSQNGFTLLELIVVLVIITVMLAISAPRLAERAQGSVVRGAAYDLQTLASAARARAVLSGQVVGLMFSSEGQELRLIAQSRTAQGSTLVDLTPRRRLPEGMQVRFIPQADDGQQEVIRFHPDGSAEAGEVRLQDKQGTEWILPVQQALGRLHWSQPS